MVPVDAPRLAEQLRECGLALLAQSAALEAADGHLTITLGDRSDERERRWRRRGEREHGGQHVGARGHALGEERRLAVGQQLVPQVEQRRAVLGGGGGGVQGRGVGEEAAGAVGDAGSDAQGAGTAAWEAVDVAIGTEAHTPIPSFNAIACKLDRRVKVVDRRVDAEDALV